MKSSMDRAFPVLTDIGDQLGKYPECPYVFFYEDGSVFRAFVCDETVVGVHTVEAKRSNNVVVVIPKETDWRMIHKEYFDVVTGSEMKAAELFSIKQERDLIKKLAKKYKLDKDKSKPGEVKKEKKFDPNNQVPHSTGQYA